MDDDKKKRPRKPGQTPFSPRGKPARGASGASAPKADKPFRKKFDRPDRRDEGGGAKRTERTGQAKPFHAGSRPDGKPGLGKRLHGGPSRSGTGPRKERPDGPAAAQASEARPPRERKTFGERNPDRDPKPFRDRKPFRDNTPDGPGEGPRRFARKPSPVGEGGRQRRERDFGPPRERVARAQGREATPLHGERGERPARERVKPLEGSERVPFRGQRDEMSFKRAEGGDAPRFKPRAERGSRPSGSEAKPFRRSFQPADEAVPGERIAKRLARVGIASRRDAEELIAAGRVKVNGKLLASPALNVTVDDVIELDGKPLPPVERTRVFLFHKPAGVVTTNRDPEGRRTVFDVLPSELPRLITVGRLDINTEGLLLLTNDGGLARVLELPATGWLRRYRVRVHGKVDERQLAGLKDGMAVDGVFYGAVEASLDREQGSNAWLTIGLREGKNREVKNILGSLGLDVTRLIRISFGPFQLGELAEGHVQELKGRMLRDQLGERLIEESGANFEAEIVKPFSNEPRRRERQRPEEAAKPRPLRDEPPVRIGEGGLIKRRQRREGTRDEALGKLSTKREAPRGERPDRGDRPFGPTSSGPKPFGGKGPRAGKKGEREQRPLEPPGGRKANVWMAPGARPIGAGRAAAEKAEADGRKERKAAYAKPAFGKGRPERPAGERTRGDGPRAPRKGGPGADRRR